MAKHSIEFEGRVTINPDTQTYYVRTLEDNIRIPANFFLHYLTQALECLNTNDVLYFGNIDAKPGDIIKLKVEVEGKE